MLGLRKTLSTLLLMVSFIILILLATNIYNSDKKKTDASDKSELVQKSGAVVVNAINFSSNLATQNIETNNNFGKKIVELVNVVDWKALVQKLIGGREISDISEVKEVQADSQVADKLINYQKTSEGAEIILKTEHGEEFKIPLPFKFLAEKSN